MTKRNLVLTTHIAVCLVCAICAGILNWLVWTYTPDAEFETLETLLYPAFRIGFALATAAATLAMVLNPLTWRVIRRLEQH